MFLRIDHTTQYRYASAVEFTPHLLRFLPRTTPGLHLLSSTLTISPEALVKWNLDLLGSIVGKATFPEKAKELLIQSSILMEQQLINPFDFLLEERATHLPILYPERERSLLTPFLQSPKTNTSEAKQSAILKGWLNSLLDCHVTSPHGAFSLETLTALNASIPTLFRYTQRHAEGLLSIEELFTKGEGTCRDFAHLMMEAARSLGIAARYISGYLCSSSEGREGESYTHGWCELFLPGAGWRGFDPANGILADAHHIAVAASVTAGEIPPVEGSYCGIPNLCIAHDATITARELLPGEESSVNIHEYTHR